MTKPARKKAMAARPKSKPGRKGGERIASPRRVEAADKARQAIQLRIGGASFRAIAAVVGYSDAAGAWNAVMRELEQAIREPTNELVTLEVERLDALFLASFPLAKQGVMLAVDRCIRIMERRARLLGLDKAQVIELTGREGGPVQVTEVIVRGSSSKPAG